MPTYNEKTAFVVRNQLTGAPLTTATVQLRRGASTIAMSHVGQGFYSANSVPRGRWEVWIDGINSGMTHGVGVGKLEDVGHEVGLYPQSQADGWSLVPLDLSAYRLLTNGDFNIPISITGTNADSSAIRIPDGSCIQAQTNAGSVQLIGGNVSTNPRFLATSTVARIIGNTNNNLGYAGGGVWEYNASGYHQWDGGISGSTAKYQFNGSAHIASTLRIGSIPTGTQVGLVGYDSNGNLIQGSAGSGFVTISGHNDLTTPWSIGDASTWATSSAGIQIDPVGSYGLYLKGNAIIEQAVSQALTLYRPVASGDICLNFDAQNSLGAQSNYAQVCGVVVSNTAGAVAGGLDFEVAVAGVSTPLLQLRQAGSTLTGALSVTGAVTATGSLAVRSGADGNIGLILQGTNLWQGAVRVTADGNASNTWTAGIFNSAPEWVLNSEGVGNAIVVNKTNRNVTITTNLLAGGALAATNAQITSAVGSPAYGIMRGGLYRWAFTPQNFGSTDDFSLGRYDDSGALVDSPFVVTRSTGTGFFGVRLRVGGGTDDLTNALQVNGAAWVGGVLKVPNTASGTVASGGWLGLDASGNVVKASAPNPFDQNLNTTNSPTFAGLLVSGSLSANGLNTTNAVVAGGYISGANTVAVTGAAATNRELQIQTANTARWGWRGDTAPESGSNNGTNLALVRYNDAGAQLGVVMDIVRSTGAMTIYNALSLSGILTATNTITGRQLAQTRQTSATTTGAITWTLTSGGTMDLTATLTGGVTMNITAPSAGAWSCLFLTQGATPQTVTLSLTGVSWISTGVNGTTGTNTITLPASDFIANKSSCVQIYWSTATRAYVTVT